MKMHLAAVRCAARAAAALLVAGIAGCSTLGLDTLRTTPSAVRLPEPVEPTREGRVAVHFEAALEQAAPLVELQHGLRERHRMGAAAVAAFRGVLAARFAEVIELPQARPAGSRPGPGIDAVLVFGAPTLASLEDPKASITPTRTVARFPLEARMTDGTTIAMTVEARAGVSGLFAAVLDRAATDAELLRNAAAILTARLRSPPWGADAPMPASTEPAPATAAVVALRLDADQARGDALEREVAACIEAVAPVPAPLRESGTSAAAALRDAVFPWLDPGVVPPRAEALAAALARPAVRHRLLALGVGRLLVVTATDAGRIDVDQLGCMGGAYGALCIGRIEQTARYTLGATLWDVATASPLAAGDAAVRTTTGAFGVLLPIPYVSSNRAEACEKLRTLVR